MNDIKPIETIYNGNRFRSRLEARWAVFFDSLGVKYEYEPEGFILGDNSYYLPDFRVKCCGCRGNCDPENPFQLYIEVKGFMTEKDAKRIKLFNNDYENPILVVGNIPQAGAETSSFKLGSYEGMDGQSVYPFNYSLVDGDCYGAFPAADVNGNFYLFGEDYINQDDADIVALAYTVARQARFEHGASPEQEAQKFRNAVLRRRSYGA